MPNIKLANSQAIVIINNDDGAVQSQPVSSLSLEDALSNPNPRQKRGSQAIENLHDSALLNVSSWEKSDRFSPTINPFTVPNPMESLVVLPSGNGWSGI
jgi:hypothetical protein